MKFNLDLVLAELKDLHPVAAFLSRPALDLDRVELLGRASAPRASTLFVAEAEELASLEAAFMRGGSFLVRGWSAELEERCRTAGVSAVFLPASPVLPAPDELLARLLEFRMRLDTWLEGILCAMARDAPLQEVFDAAAAGFSNPLMLSDSALYFVLVAGTLPEGFRDALWTPALETGVCPSELYLDAWSSSAGGAFDRREAYLVRNPSGDGLDYLVRNLMSAGAYHGCFELVSANAPLTPADVALADRFGELLSMILPRQTYPQIAGVSKGPLRDLLAGVPVRPSVLEYELAEIGWSVRDVYYVVRFSGTEDDEEPGPRAQTVRRIAEFYPLARFYESGGKPVMVARDADYPLSRLHARHEAHDVDEGAEPRFRAGFSSLFDDFALVRTAADQAAFAYARVGASPASGAFGVSRTCFYDDCWTEDLACRLTEEARGEDAGPGRAAAAGVPSEDAPIDGGERLLDRAAVALAEADARDGTDHLSTALAYLEHGCSAARTAEALFIHRNTLAYRLKRIKALSGIDLENPAEAGVDLLRVFLSCRLLAS